MESRTLTLTASPANPISAKNLSELMQALEIPVDSNTSLDRGICLKMAYYFLSGKIIRVSRYFGVLNEIYDLAKATHQEKPEQTLKDIILEIMENARCKEYPALSQVAIDFVIRIPNFCRDILHYSRHLDQEPFGILLSEASTGLYTPENVRYYFHSFSHAVDTLPIKLHPANLPVTLLLQNNTRALMVGYIRETKQWYMLDPHRGTVEQMNILQDLPTFVTDRFSASKMGKVVFSTWLVDSETTLLNQAFPQKLLEKWWGDKQWIDVTQLEPSYFNESDDMGITVNQLAALHGDSTVTQQSAPALTPPPAPTVVLPVAAEKDSSSDMKVLTEQQNALSTRRYETRSVRKQQLANADKLTLFASRDAANNKKRPNEAAALEAPVFKVPFPVKKS